MKRLVLMLILMFISSLAYSQQPPNTGSPCPPGMIPGYGKCYAPDDPDRFDRGSEVEKPAYTGPLWQDRYGAIASDSKTGSIGWFSNAKSKREAVKAAIEDCGGGGCEIKAQGRNTCLASAWGGGISGYGAAAKLQLAEKQALENCMNGGSECKITYSACSLPVRIR